MTPRDQLIEHLRFAEELGLDGVSLDPDWTRRARAGESSPPGGARDDGAREQDAEAARHPRDPAPSGAGSAPIPIARSKADALAAVREDLGECTRCKLHTLGRRQIVFGVGNPKADLMFVGEAPGHDEDVQGLPFVGRAGQLLTRIIEAVQLRRDDVYIANVIKCRPPGNRNPAPDEVATCQPFLAAQIDAVGPKVIVALGTFAAQALLGTTDPISRLRGRVYDYRGAKLIPTFHPAFLLRSPDRKRDTWQDMKTARAILTGAE